MMQHKWDSVFQKWSKQEKEKQLQKVYFLACWCSDLER